MAIKEFLRKIMNSEAPDEEPDIDDDVTKDKALRSLRRQRRVQLEGLEKELLKKKIQLHQKAEMKRNMFGIGDSMLTEKQGIVKRSKDILKHNSGGFLGKSRL